MPANLLHPNDLFIPTPVTREYTYNKAVGGYLSYKSQAQSNSTLFSASSLPSINATF